MERTKVAVPNQVITGLEAVRVSGKSNMFDVSEVIRLAIEMEQYGAALWVDENRSLYFFGLFHGFEDAEGGESQCVG